MSRGPLTSATRRRALASAGAALLGSTATHAEPTSEGIDAELIRLAAEMIALELRYLAHVREGYALLACDPVFVRLNGAACALVGPLNGLRDQVAALPAHTLEGVRAKAEVLRYWLVPDPDGPDGCELHDDDALAWSLVQDVLRLA